MDEQEFEIYSEWAETNLVWGKGMFNWCRTYSKEEWENHSGLRKSNIDEDVINNNPLCQFGPSKNERIDYE